MTMCCYYYYTKSNVVHAFPITNILVAKYPSTVIKSKTISFIIFYTKTIHITWTITISFNGSDASSYCYPKASFDH